MPAASGRNNSPRNPLRRRVRSPSPRRSKGPKKQLNNIKRQSSRPRTRHVSPRSHRSANSQEERESNVVASAKKIMGMLLTRSHRSQPSRQSSTVHVDNNAEEEPLRMATTTTTTSLSRPDEDEEEPVVERRQEQDGSSQSEDDNVPLLSSGAVALPTDNSTKEVLERVHPDTGEVELWATVPFLEERDDTFCTLDQEWEHFDKLAYGEEDSIRNVGHSSKIHSKTDEEDDDDEEPILTVRSQALSLQSGITRGEEEDIKIRRLSDPIDEDDEEEEEDKEEDKNLQPVSPLKKERSGEKYLHHTFDQGAAELVFTMSSFSDAMEESQMGDDDDETEYGYDDVSAFESVRQLEVHPTVSYEAERAGFKDDEDRTKRKGRNSDSSWNYWTIGCSYPTRELTEPIPMPKQNKNLAGKDASSSLANDNDSQEVMTASTQDSDAIYLEEI